MKINDIDMNAICGIAQKAGDIILEIYESDDFAIETKEDNSPLTRADTAANDYICSELNKLYPDIPVLSEERKATEFEERQHWLHCFIVDPIDGTKEFIKKNGEFTVNIAYAIEGKVVEGVIFAPVLKTLYFTSAGKSFRMKGGDCEMLPIDQKETVYKIVTSRSHISDKTQGFVDQMKASHPNLELVSVGSSLKFCMIAEGSADIYPRFNPTMEWDTAAAQAIVEQAGGQVLNLHTKEPLTYNKKDLLNPEFMVWRRSSI